jgi:hypothetical protein
LSSSILPSNILYEFVMTLRFKMNLIYVDKNGVQLPVTHSQSTRTYHIFPACFKTPPVSEVFLSTVDSYCLWLKHLSCVLRGYKGPLVCYVAMYCGRSEAVSFAYVTSLWVEGNQMHMLCKPKTLSIQELRRPATNYCRWEIMFIVWTVYTSSSAAPPTPLIPLPFTVFF